MERENSVREHMEKQICEIQMNAVLAASALKESDLLIGTEQAEEETSFLKQFLPAQTPFA